MVRRTDRPAMTIAVDLGCKATKQTKQNLTIDFHNTSKALFIIVATNSLYKSQNYIR